MQGWRFVADEETWSFWVFV